MAERRGPADWGTVAALAVCAALLSVIRPGPLLLLPFAVLALALPPRRPVVALAGLLMVGAVMAWGSDGLLWYFERGWALLAAAWFVVMVVLLPRAGFIERALGAVLGAEVTAALLLAVNRGGFQRLDAAIGGRIRDASATAVAAWQRMETSPGAERPNETLELFRDLMYRAAELQALIFPALLALSTLAGLAVAWWAFGRLGRGEAEPLRPLREFRFPNGLVWLLIVGLVLLLLPVGDGAARIGSNLLTFMIGLYAVRGLAVLVMVVGMPGPLGLAAVVLAVVTIYPMLMGAVFAAFVGLSDTWLDIRARRRAPSAG